VVESEDEITGVGGHSRLIASQADREQVVDALKAAFVQGRLTKDEFDHRVVSTSWTYASRHHGLAGSVFAGWANAKSAQGCSVTGKDADVAAGGQNGDLGPGASAADVP
jgi:Domain of unknown function (DUF1707)